LIASNKLYVPDLGNLSAIRGSRISIHPLPFSYFRLLDLQ